MDLFGFLLGAGALVGWYFSNGNTVISNIIFIFIYVAIIKVVKFGSLRLALVTFICSLILSIVFTILIAESNTYMTMVYSNNPLFLAAPTFARIPN